MVWLAIIGSASIQIRADDKYFEPDVRRAVGKLKNVEIQLRIDGDIAKASKKIRDLRYRITNNVAVLKVDADVTKAEDKLTKLLEKFVNKDLQFNAVANTQGANTQLSELQGRFTATRVPFTATANTRAASAALAFTARRRTAEIDARISPATMAALTGLFNTITGTLPIDKVKASIQGLAANFEGIALKVGLVTAAIGALSAAVLTGAANLVSIASDLTQLGGLIALLPAGLFALRTVLLANKFAWEGFGDAASDNSAKANEALAKLPPNAQAAALALRGVKDEIQKPVQAAFWEQVGTALQDMVEAQLPSVIDGLSGIASAWGRFNKEVFDTVANMGDFNDVFLNVEEMVDNLTPAIQPAITALGQFIGIGSNFLPRFGTYISELATRFGAWADAAYKSGEMLGWMNTAIDRAQELGSIIGSTARIFDGLADAARLSGAAGLTELAAGMREIAAIVNGEPFQSRLVTILEGARSGTDALGEGFASLTEYIGRSARGISIFLDVTGEIAGVALDSIRALFDGTGLGEGLYQALSGLRDGLIALEPGFGQLGSALGGLGRIAGELFVNMAPGLNQLFETLNGVVSGLEDGIISAMPVFNEFIQAILAVVQGPIVDLANFLGDALEAFSKLPDGIQTAIMALGLFLALKGKFVGFFAPLMTSLGELVTNTKSKFDGVEGAANKMKVGASAAFSGMLGLIGGAVGAAALLITGAFADYAREQQNATTQVDNVTKAFEASGGVINGVVRGAIEANLRLKDSFLGVFESVSGVDIAKEIGVPLDDVVDAAAGVPGAMNKVQDSLRDTGNEATTTGAMFQTFIDIIRNSGGPGAGFAKVLDFFNIGQTKGDQLNRVIGEQARVVEEAKIKHQALGEQLNIGTTAASRLADNHKTLADATASASSRADALRENIDILGDSMNSSREAARDHATQMFDLQDSMAKLGEAQGFVLDSTGRMNDGFRDSLLKDGVFHTASREAIEFSKQMDGAASSIVDMGIAEMRRLEATGANTATAQAGAIDVMKGQTKILRDSLITLGFDATIADGIISQLGLDETKLEGAMKLNTADAEASAQRFQVMLGALQNGNWEVVLAASTNEIQNSLLQVDAYKAAYETGGWEAVVGIIDEAGPGIEDLMIKLSEAKSQAEIDAIIRAEFEGKGVVDGATSDLQAVDAIEAKPTISAEDLTSAGTDSARLTMGSLPDIIRSLLAQDGTGPGKDLAQGTMGLLTDVTRFFYAKDETNGGKTAAQSTMDTLMDVTRSLFGRNDAGSGRNAAQGTMETFMDVTRSLFAANEAWRGKDAAQGSVNQFNGKTVDLNANDNASGVVRDINNTNLQPKQLSISAIISGISAAARMALGLADGGIIKGGTLQFADGGILNRATTPAIKSFAGGGTENHVAQIARGAWPVRIWAEPETGGEAYLPLHPNKRKRSLEILREVMKEFGLGHLAMQFADGGMIPSGTRYTQPSVVSARYSTNELGSRQAVTTTAPAGPASVVNFTVNPSRGLSEEQIGEAAMRELYWQITSR